MTRFLFSVLVSLAAPLVAGAATDVTLFRIFLGDGTALVSYGEYARVGDQVIFSMPIGGPADEPRLQVVTVSAASIDWSRTESYANAARYQRYVETRGDADFQVLSDEVAGTLNDIALTTDRQRALANAERVRTMLAEWPQAHFGYRQNDVREILGLLDEAINGLKVSAGASPFELILVATPSAADVEPVMGTPSAREQVDHLFKLADLSPRPTDRVALLQSALALLNEAGASIGAIDTTTLRRTAEKRLEYEAAIDARYTRLSRRLMEAATRSAASARVGDVERLLDQLPREDARLGQQRPETVQSLRASLEGELEAARRLRLMRDQWTVRRSLYRDYQSSVGSQLLQLVKVQPWLEQIRRLEGPSPDRLSRLRSRLNGGAERLQRLTVPESVRPTHDLLISAWRFAENAVNVRYEAVSSGSVSTAWQASSAAAGALLMLQRAQQDLRTLLQPPQLAR